MKIRAEMGHWSSVVGGGVHLIGDDGRMVGQIMFCCHTDDLRERDVQMRLARICCDAINATPVGGVTVKPLVFQGRNGFWRADDGIGGFFEVAEVSGSFHMCRIVHGHANKMIPYSTKETAFAACQVEHDRRILSVLESAP